MQPDWMHARRRGSLPSAALEGQPRTLGPRDWAAVISADEATHGRACSHGKELEWELKRTSFSSC